MARARPGSWRAWGVAVPPAAGYAVTLVLCLGALTACSDEALAPPAAEPLSSAGQGACDAFLAAVPTTVDRGSLTCGAPEPATLEPTSQCDEVRAVGWFIDPDALADPESAVVATAVGVRPRVAVLFTPGERGQRSLEVLSALADPVREHLETVSRCR